jgi:hypothetical protein
MPAAVVAAPLPARTAVARSVTERSYAVRSSATIERDSASRTDVQRIETRVTVALGVSRSNEGNVRGSGRIDAFSVQLTGAGVVVPLPPASRAPTTPRTTAVDSFKPVLFDAVLDAASMRVTTRPPMVNECDRNEAGAVSVVHELLIRVPASVVRGESWRDSTSSVLCRVGMPITVHATHEYLVESIDGGTSTASLRLKRTTSTRLDGKVTTTWRTLELTGVGTGTDDMRVDALSGAVQSLDGQSVLTVQVSERGRSTATRSQRMTQKSTLHAEMLR